MSKAAPHSLKPDLSEWQHSSPVQPHVNCNNKKYESPTSSGKEALAKVKVFEKYVKFQGQGH